MKFKLIIVSMLLIVSCLIAAGILIENIINNENIFDHPTPIKECDNKFGAGNWSIECTDWMNVDWDKVNHNLYWSNNSHTYRCIPNELNV